MKRNDELYNRFIACRNSSKNSSQSYADLKNENEQLKNQIQSVEQQLSSVKVLLDEQRINMDMEYITEKRFEDRLQDFSENEIQRCLDTIVDDIENLQNELSEIKAVMKSRPQSTSSSSHDNPRQAIDTDKSSRGRSLSVRRT